jgi:hypothetical protein
VSLFRSYYRTARNALARGGPAGLAAVGWAIVQTFVALKQRIGRSFAWLSPPRQAGVLVFREVSERTSGGRPRESTRRIQDGQ